MRYLAAALIAATCVPIHAAGATTYRFLSTSDGFYKGHSEGRVLISGSRWRIDFDPSADERVVHHVVIGSATGDVTAINSANHTWYHLDRAALAARGFLFGYPGANNASKIIVTPHPKSVTFSYTFDVTMASETIHGDVRGEIRVTTTDQHAELPWSPAAIHTGFAAVDDALQSALNRIDGTPLKAEIEISRALAGGPTLRQTITRGITAMTETTATDSDFAVPAGYREQAPVIGAPGN